MPNPYQRADFYRSQIVGDFRIGQHFADCHMTFGFSAQMLTPKNDSITRDIEYSFDGTGIAGRLKKGTEALKGGEWYDYEDGDQPEIYLRIAPDEYQDGDGDGDNPIAFRVWGFRGLGGRSS